MCPNVEYAAFCLMVDFPRPASNGAVCAGTNTQIEKIALSVMMFRPEYLREREQMVRLPDPSIALWIVVACWVVALIAYLVHGPTFLIIPLFVLGVFTGMIEWLLRRNTN